MDEINATRLTTIINNEFTPHMGEIRQLIKYAKNEDKELVSYIDFEKVAKFIEQRKQVLIGDIAVYCGNSQVRQNLTKLVKANEGNEFESYKFIDIFGDLKDSSTLGYKLIQTNLMYYQCQTQLLSFHAPIVRDAISQLPMKSKIV